MSDINYQCSVVRLKNVRKHPNADKLNIADVFGNTVIVGLDNKDGDLGLFFPIESKIGAEFIKVNNLYRDKELNSDKSKQGFFELNGRVRAMKLRGIPSMGYWCELKCLDKLDIVDLPEENTSFNQWEGIEICTKYVPKVRHNPDTRIQSRKKHDRFIKGQFKEHLDTEHLFKNLNKISKDSQIVLTWKLHGTSARAGNVLVQRKLGPLERTLRFFGIKVQDTEYAYLYGSRKVIKDPSSLNQNHYYESDLWTSVGKSNFEGKLHKGEQIYYEIVGYVPGTQSLIQKGFTYGCKEGQCNVYIYRITNTNTDGQSVDLSWEALKERCLELEIQYVPECIIFENFILTSEYIKTTYLEGDCHLDKSHPEEGICLRVEGLIPAIYKAKAFRFLEWETKQLDSGESDIETEQS